MKKLLTVLILIASMGLLEAAPIKKPKKDLTEEQLEYLEKMEARIDEIKAMDFKAMSKEEVKAVKEELREMKKEAEGKGIYLSVGAIIIIILLLILIL
ncbi:hypothetical protein Aoki45_20380 [Algoriphagus sp. oki45]|uniref:hypothetical protein n=1 Tax=Algoriphagus sp. oki45 TaxID=3067294 RepID=UPI0027FFF7CD|nr:hypothetical protein Aoki45_20380 [Algoriphagus sp. oki45]